MTIELAFDPNWLRTELAIYHKTLETFAHDLGVASSTVSRWLNSHNRPNRLTLKAIDNQLLTYRKESDDARMARTAC